MVTNLPKDTDSKRYVGRDVELVFSDAPTAAELEQVEGWADKIQQMSGPHKVIFIEMGGGGNHQTQELIQHLLAEDEANRRYLVQEPPRGPRKGKGQRKANRGGRWA